MAAVADGLAREFPETNTGRGVTHRAAARRARRPRTAPHGAAVPRRRRLRAADLLRERGEPVARPRDGAQRELAVRSALGASAAACIRQLLTETCPARRSRRRARTGGRRGDPAGRAVAHPARSCCPRPSRSQFDARVVAFCFVDGAARRSAVRPRAGVAGDAAAAAQVIASETPDVDRPRRPDARRARRRRGCDRRPAALRRGPAAAHAARGRSRRSRISRRRRADDGRRPAGVGFPSQASMLQFYDEVEQEVMAVPGVRSVGWATTLPLGPSYSSAQPPSSSPASRLAKRQACRWPTIQIVSPGLLPDLDLPIVAGRGFDDRDVADSAARLHRQRGLRPHSSPGPVADRHAHRHAARCVDAGTSPSCAKSSAWRGR